MSSSCARRSTPASSALSRAAGGRRCTQESIATSRREQREPVRETAGNKVLVTTCSNCVRQAGGADHTSRWQQAAASSGSPGERRGEDRVSGVVMFALVCCGVGIQTLRVYGQQAAASSGSLGKEPRVVHLRCDDVNDYGRIRPTAVQLRHDLSPTSRRSLDYDTTPPSPLRIRPAERLQPCPLPPYLACQTVCCLGCPSTPGRSRVADPRCPALGPAGTAAPGPRVY